MKITLITYNGNQPARLILCQNGRDMPCIGYKETTDSTVEILEFVRAKAAQPVDRGNLHTTITFSTSYQLDTPAKAEIEIHDLRGRTPTTADVEFESSSSSERILRQLENAVIRITDLSYSGVRVFVSYQIVGGIITTP